MIAGTRRLVFRLDLCGGRVGHRRRSMCGSPSGLASGASLIRRDMNESDTEAHSKAVDSLLNYETVKYFGNEELRGAAFRFLDGALREGRDPHLYLARPAQYRAGGDLHRRHGDLHAAGGARRDAGRADRRRLCHDQRDPHPALSAAEFHGHGLSRDQAGPDRCRDHVRAAAREARDRRPSRRQAAPCHARARSNSRTCPSPTTRSGRS